ncbi:tight adherence protein B [Sphingobium sp. B2D3A]|uniref:type II secretion system F family protein n=1 Tax=unclassified Sphingobium TaxID=2611147 RepID=UPI0022255E7C|nr:MULTISPECIES: type II secretion system F family protein [unclassified Sphingobium]MCW2336537.1 tight adherence protein B [Sphingobium sp. B2D3A]MCW2386291.1 tight adherence protein B [Sphingobium sp. B2D3D]
MNSQLLLLILLAAMAIALLVMALSGPSADRVGSRRIAAIRGRHASSESNQIEARMRKAIAARGLDQGHLFTSLIPNPELLATRLRMTGKKWTLSQYVTTSVALAIGVLAIMVLRDYSFLLSVLVAIAIAFGIPHFVVGRLIARRVNKFTTNFPDALDLLVRGLRSGLPVGETMMVVSQEIPGPVGEEFKLITERIKIGQSMDQALQETAARLGTAEFKFFCITINIQRETGGNLAETLANLSNVLRQRAQMKLKIRAMSSESKASAYIIGALPFIVFGLISWINFKYMSAFFIGDPNGVFGLSLMQVIAIGAMMWMSIGVFIMAKMISFEI